MTIEELIPVKVVGKLNLIVFRMESVSLSCFTIINLGMQLVLGVEQVVVFKLAIPIFIIKYFLNVCEPCWFSGKIVANINNIAHCFGRVGL